MSRDDNMLASALWLVAGGAAGYAAGRFVVGPLLAGRPKPASSTVVAAVSAPRPTVRATRALPAGPSGTMQPIDPYGSPVIDVVVPGPSGDMQPVDPYADKTPTIAPVTITTTQPTAPSAPAPIDGPVTRPPELPNVTSPTPSGPITRPSEVPSGQSTITSGPITHPAQTETVRPSEPTAPVKPVTSSEQAPRAAFATKPRVRRKYWIRAKVVDPRTGKNKEIDRILEGVTAHEAAQKRDLLISEIKNPPELTKKVRVGEFAQSWMKSKALKLDSSTARTYADALEKHILPALGDLYYDALTSQDVQRWIDDALTRGWTSEKRGSKRSSKTARRAYTRDTVAGWFRVFRTMTRDAMVTLGLPRDPTLRIVLPERSMDDEESNALSPDELFAFLDAMKTGYPQHHALVALLAYTGLRFCHASALHWEDWDETAGVLRITRKNVRGKLGSVTRKKRAPKEYPVLPELAEILSAHRARLEAAAVENPDLTKKGYMFPSSVGTLRTPNTLDRAWQSCLAKAKITKRFTVHGLRYTFTDLVRLANVDAVVRRALTGHVTEEMQRHYSTVGLDEKRAAIRGVLRLVPPSPGTEGTSTTEGGVSGGGSAAPLRIAG